MKFQTFFSRGEYIIMMVRRQQSADGRDKNLAGEEIGGAGDAEIQKNCVILQFGDK